QRVDAVEQDDRRETYDGSSEQQHPEDQRSDAAHDEHPPVLRQALHRAPIPAIHVPGTSRAGERAGGAQAAGSRGRPLAAAGAGRALRSTADAERRSGEHAGGAAPSSRAALSDGTRVDAAPGMPPAADIAECANICEATARASREAARHWLAIG